MKRKLDKENRLVIPAEMRKELGLESKSQVNMEIENNKLIITNPKEVEYKAIVKAIEYIKKISNEFDIEDEIQFDLAEVIEILEGDK